MKTILILILFVGNITLMCNSDVPIDKKITENNISKNKTASVTEKKDAVQSSNYDDLFKLNSDICLTTTEIAKATKLPESAIQKKEIKGSKTCTYTIKLPNGETMDYRFFVAKSDLANVKKEIKSFLKSKKNGEFKIMKTNIDLSDTGDCYLTQINRAGRLNVLNPNYPNIIYSQWSLIAPYKLNQKQKEIRISYAKNILNFLIKKHRK